MLGDCGDLGEFWDFGPEDLGGFKGLSRTGGLEGVGDFGGLEGIGGLRTLEARVPLLTWMEKLKNILQFGQLYL